MELVLTNGEACVRKNINNEKIYKTLSASKIDGIPEILKIQDGVVYYKYVNGETLANRIKNDSNITKDFIRFIVFSCATILKSLKDYNIVHNDITPDNIIITPKGKLYLIDFETATFEGQTVAVFEGDSNYAAPEVVNKQITTFQSDLYSIGKIISELDSRNQFANITKKCLDNRYQSYTALIHELNSVYSTIEDDTDDYSLLNYYNRPALLAIAFIVCSSAIIGFLLSRLAESSNTLIYIIFSIYVGLVIGDILDYTRLVIFESRHYKKILPFKVAISFVMFFITVFVSIILVF